MRKNNEKGKESIPSKASREKNWCDLQYRFVIMLSEPLGCSYQIWIDFCAVPNGYLNKAYVGLFETGEHNSDIIQEYHWGEYNMSIDSIAYATGRVIEELEEFDFAETVQAFKQADCDIDVVGNALQGLINNCFNE